MSKKKRIKPRRRSLVPAQRPATSPTAETVPESRLHRASRIATVLGAGALLLALAAQQKWISVDLGPSGSTILKVAGVGLIIAGLVFGRAAKR